LPEITLNNNIDPGSSKVGQNFNFVLNYCKKAGKTEKNSNLNCVENDVDLRNFVKLFGV
jgi:hypothetical protein